MHNYHSANLNLLINAAKKAARILIRDYKEIGNLQSSRKPLNNFVNITIGRVEQLLIVELSKNKNYQISINSTYLNKISNGFGWVVKSLDGINNFMHANPFFSINLALEKIVDSRAEIIAEVIYAPAFGELYWTEKGGGSWVEKHTETLSGRNRLRVSTRSQLNEALINIEELTIKSQLFLIERLNNSKLRIHGSAALSLAHLAAGQSDISIISNDNSFGHLLAKEAGAELIENNQHNLIIDYSIFHNGYLDKELKMSLRQIKDF